jgi:hypothetical protein
MNASIRGQILLLFAASLVVVIAMAGLLIDGGFLLSNHRQAQAAADTGALAAALAANDGDDPVLAARAVASANGFVDPLIDCDGSSTANEGVEVNRPPSSGAFMGDDSYVEVVTTRAMQTAFARAIGMPCFLVSARAVARISSPSVANCSFCSLSNWADRYTLLLDSGNDLRVDGDIFANQNSWYTGSTAISRCGANPCSPPTCDDWNPSPGEDRILMCGQALYVDHSGGSTPSILSANTISSVGGWQARSENDIVHADEKTPTCPASPRNLNYPLAIQETNVCIGLPQLVDPLNDPSNPSGIMPTPDYEALSSCGGPPYCPPVASATCAAEPGTTLKLPVGTLNSPAKLNISGTQGKFTICPGLYFGGFSTNGDNGSQPRVIMLPGTYVMIGGGFSVTGRASITSVSSRGDGVTVYNSGGSEAFSLNFPSDPTLIPSACPNPPSLPTSACNATGSTVLNPPAGPKPAGTPVTYELTLAPGPSLPKPTGGPASFTFYNGTDPIACSGGVVISGTTNHVAECTTSYNEFGDKGITAVYEGDLIYAPTGATKTQRIIPPPGAGIDNVNLSTQDGNACGAAVAPCGQIVLHAPTSGSYSGLLIFQDRAIGFLQGTQGLEIDPFLGAGACDTTPITTPLGIQPAFMAYGVAAYGPPSSTQPVPAPCGPLGGLSGTIYAAHVATGAPSDWDAVVNIRASGLATLQIIAAEIHFTQGNPSNQARFAYDASLFANGSIRLVE